MCRFILLCSHIIFFCDYHIQFLIVHIWIFQNLDQRCSTYIFTVLIHTYVPDQKRQSLWTDFQITDLVIEVMDHRVIFHLHLFISISFFLILFPPSCLTLCVHLSLSLSLSLSFSLSLFLLLCRSISPQKIKNYITIINFTRTTDYCILYHNFSYDG